MVTVWRQPDQFDWFGAYLLDRGLQTRWRVATFLFTVGLAIVPLVMLASPVGPDTPLTRGVAIAAALVAAGVSLVWLFGWPSRRGSVVYNIVCSGCVAATCLSMSNAYGALMGCTVFAVLGGFLAYFHTIGHVVANLSLAMVCAVGAAIRLVSGTGDVALTVSAGLIVVALNIGVPFGIISLVHLLRTDLRNSDRDPLTGLLNRRSFFNAVAELIAVQSPTQRRRLNITMLDLDNFKGLNDTHGHAAGDAALVSVADVLRNSCEPGAVTARLGGEEFLIADTDFVGPHRAMIERVREGIAAAPLGITASLGICSMVADPGVGIGNLQFVERMIKTADVAMYRAKRAGGNRVAHLEFDATDDER